MRCLFWRSQTLTRRRQMSRIARNAGSRRGSRTVAPRGRPRSEYLPARSWRRAPARPMSPTRRCTRGGRAGRRAGRSPPVVIPAVRSDARRVRLGGTKDHPKPDTGTAGPVARHGGSALPNLALPGQEAPATPAPHPACGRRLRRRPRPGMRFAGEHAPSRTVRASRKPSMQRRRVADVPASGRATGHHLTPTCACCKK